LHVALRGRNARAGAEEEKTEEEEACSKGVNMKEPRAQSQVGEVGVVYLDMQVYLEIQVN
jgi:hypothetical protein